MKNPFKKKSTEEDLKSATDGYFQTLEYVAGSAYIRGYMDRDEVGQPTWLPGSEITDHVMKSFYADLEYFGDGACDRLLSFLKELPKRDVGEFIMFGVGSSITAQEQVSQVTRRIGELMADDGMKITGHPKNPTLFRIEL